MERAELWDRVLAVFGDQLVEEQTPVGDVDSLALVEVAMDLEDATGVELAEADMAGTLGDVLDLVVARQAASGKTEP